MVTMVWPGPSCFASGHGRRHIDARRAAEQQAFLAQQPVHEVHGLRIRDAQRIVDGCAFEIRGHAAGADALGDRRAAVGLQLAVLEVVIQRAARRIDQHDANRAGFRFEIARDARQRAAGAGGGAKRVDLAVGVAPDLRARRFEMRVAIGGIVELIGPNRVRAAPRPGARHF
jgi:hypothetical protein